ncbi:MAG: alpha-amylase family glycosyl hydrolase [Bacteroidota bacterium]|nr:alpha-amylase family glycosyl hydrolase [Bacteroidota bacterium]
MYLKILLISIVLISNLLAQVKPKSAEWVPNAVFYEIYPQTFYDTDADGIGDLKGIIQKLDYVKSLGVNAIWLNPFYESPFRDAGYDVSDYYKVAARYGTNDDAKKLFEEAHKRGLRVIVDFVPGHTSKDHPWFKESAKPEKNKYSNWYIWTNSTWNNGGNDNGRGIITGYSERDGGYMTNFFWHQPALNFGYGVPDTIQKWQLPVNHPDILALRDEMKKIMRHWLDMGCDGFRVDMAGSIIRKDKNGEGFKFWQEVHDMLAKDYPHAFTVSEWSYPKDAIKAGFTADFLHWIPEYENLFRKEQWRSLNNVSPNGKSFFDKDGKGDISAFIKAWLDQYNATKAKGYISVPVGNHDLSRINVNHTDSEIEMIYAFSFALPGIPFVYYGDEIGMKQLYNLPAIEGCYPPRAGARTPMQWEGGVNKGFSTGASNQLWLAVDTSTKAPNVLESEKSSNSLLNKMRKLINLRRTEKALLAYADVEMLYCEKDKYPFVMARTCEGQKLITAFNPSATESTIQVNYKNAGKKPMILIETGKSVIKNSATGFTLTLKGQSYIYFRLE